MRPVSGSLPQLGVVDVGGDDLLEAAFPVLLLDEADEGVVDVRAARLEEARARRQFVEEEQLLFLETETRAFF